MTRALPFTEAKVRRALVGAQRAGLAVKAMQIGPDGTITLHYTDAPALASPDPAPHDAAAKWGAPRA